MSSAVSNACYKEYLGPRLPERSDAAHSDLSSSRQTTRRLHVACRLLVCSNSLLF